MRANPRHAVIVFAKTTAQHKRFAAIYDRHVGPFYRAVLRWMRLMREAIRYGIDTQMIQGLEPDPTYLEMPDPWRPKTKLTKRTVELAAERLAQRLSEVVKVQNFTDITTTLVDWNCVANRGSHAIGPHQLRIYGKAAGVAGELAKIRTPWNVVNQRAVEWAAAHSNDLVTLISNETRQTLREIIAAGIKDGKPMPKIGREIRPHIGLNAQQSKALDNFRAALEDQFSQMRGGMTPARQALVERAVNREADKKLAYRSEMIARTETARSVSEGTLETYRAANVERIRFDSSADACLECAFYDGNVFTLLEGEGLIPLHPNCRCSWTPVTGYEPELGIKPYDEDELVPAPGIPYQPPVGPPPTVLPPTGAGAGTPPASAPVEPTPVAPEPLPMDAASKLKEPLEGDNIASLTYSSTPDNERLLESLHNSFLDRFEHPTPGQVQIADALANQGTTRAVLYDSHQYGQPIHGAISYGKVGAEDAAHKGWYTIQHLGSDGTVKGTGKELMRYAVEAAGQSRTGIIFEATPDAVGFYERLGFVHLDPAQPKIMGADSKLVGKIRRALGKPGRRAKPVPKPKVVPKPAAAPPSGSAFSTGGIETSTNLGGGVNQTAKVHIGGDGDGVYKPKAGERGGLRGSIPDGTMYKRERAAYVVDQHLGFDLVPETVIKDGPEGIGSVQAWVNKADVGYKLTSAEEALVTESTKMKLDLFDLLVANSDRHGGNWMMVKEGAEAGRVVAIDNGLCFGSNKAFRKGFDNLRLAFTYSDLESKVPAELVAKLETFIANRSIIEKELSGLLSKNEVASVFDRAQYIVRNKDSTFNMFWGFEKWLKTAKH